MTEKHKQKLAHEARGMAKAYAQLSDAIGDDGVTALMGNINQAIKCPACSEHLLKLNRDELLLIASALTAMENARLLDLFHELENQERDHDARTRN